MLGIGGTVLGAAALSAVSPNGADTYVQSSARSFATESYALVSPTLELVIDEPAIARTPFDLGEVRLQAEAAGSEQDIFIGIGARADVDKYLGDVARAEIQSITSFPSDVRYEEKSGNDTPTNPATETFWLASAHGPGLQTLVTPVHSGEWVVVVMNADATPSVATNLQAGYHSDQLGILPLIALLVGAMTFLIGVGLIWLGAARAGKNLSQSQIGSDKKPLADGETATINSVLGHPSETMFYGKLGNELSRGLWLVKWLLAVPHFVVLFFLWFALFVTTVIAGLAVLFTGRYPRSLFAFNVGVLRWNWRVAFYAHSALGTDVYPPFTLASTDYPADLNVAYPERLSRGLVLIKGWILAVPHLLIVAIFTGAGVIWFGQNSPTNPGQPGLEYSLLGTLVLIAGLILLFTGTYRQGLFGLIMGINRWIFRVTIYVALMRDEYPPFRLDQGGDDPSMTTTNPENVEVLS
ncbi:DUF4389 domain-containing protein [Paenarthrobacter sp. NPDC091669]|uniref:DUF4389 domain-containing protein n=1 Tax=Paenarthrobacter sp. NPDC091669 TaxID=3364384 RepID=UPI0037FFD695